MLFAGLLIFITLIFIQPQEFLPGMIGMRLVAIVMGVIGISWIFSALASRKSRLFETPQNKLILIFWMVIVISTISVNWLRYTLDKFIECGKIVLIFILIINIVDSLKKFRKTIVTIVLCVLAIAGAGILQYYGRDITGVGMQLGGRIRGVGIFDTNQLAYTIAFCIPFVFCLMIIFKSFLMRLFLVSSLAIYFFCGYLTQSRGGNITIVFALFLTFSIFSKRRITKITGVILSVTIFFAILFNSSRFSTIPQYQADESSMNRLYVWGESLTALKNHLLFGVGKGQFADNFHMAAHSSYIEVISELGIIGLYIWLALFYFSIRNLRYIYKFFYDKSLWQLNYFAKGLLISIYAYLVGGLFSSSSYYITLFIIFSLVVALQYLSGEKILKLCNRVNFGDFLVIGIIECAVIFGLHFWIRMAS